MSKQTSIFDTLREMAHPPKYTTLQVPAGVALLVGGPGSGKTSLVLTVGKAAQERGEVFFCGYFEGDERIPEFENLPRVTSFFVLEELLDHLESLPPFEDSSLERAVIVDGLVPLITTESTFSSKPVWKATHEVCSRLHQVGKRLKIPVLITMQQRPGLARTNTGRMGQVNPDVPAPHYPVIYLGDSK